MGIYETFSKRQKKRERAGKPEVYQYDSLPRAFRIQVIHIWVGAIGPFYGWDPGFESEPASSRSWRLIHDTLAREIGVFNLGNTNENPFVQCQQYLLTADTAGALDIIELTFLFIDTRLRNLAGYGRAKASIKQNADEAIQELNHRFHEHAIGYQYVGGELIRMDSQYIHEEAVKPAISLLQDAGFRGASDEFLRAHEHYRKVRYKEAVADALKSFESTMKAICDTRHWPYPENATAIPLIKILLEKGLIPKDLEGHFGGLRAAMESGLPTISNRTSRHGQGKEPKEIPGYFAAYALHLAASNIVFLVEAHKNIK